MDPPKEAQLLAGAAPNDHDRPHHLDGIAGRYEPPCYNGADRHDIAVDHDPNGAGDDHLVHFAALSGRSASDSPDHHRHHHVDHLCDYDNDGPPDHDDDSPNDYDNAPNDYDNSPDDYYDSRHYHHHIAGNYHQSPAHHHDRGNHHDRACHHNHAPGVNYNHSPPDDHDFLSTRAGRAKCSPGEREAPGGDWRGG